MANVYLGLGGNVADTKAYFARAIEKLKEIGTVSKISSLYKTEPVGFKEQAWFLNGVLLLETNLSPENLFTKIKKIEKELGRTPAARNGPREIDIDILLYDNIVLKTDTLTIPHPRMHERGFVLKPLSEIAPKATHPTLEKTAERLLQELTDAPVCERYTAFIV